MAPQVHLYDATLTEGLWAQGVHLDTDRRQALAEQLARAAVDFVEIALVDARNGHLTVYRALERPPETPATRWSVQVRLPASSPVRDEAIWQQVAAQPGSAVLLSLRLGHDEAVSPSFRQRIATFLTRVRSLKRLPILRVEDFFQVYRNTPERIWPALQTFWNAARPILTLGDMEGRTLPWEVAVATHDVHRRFPQATLGFWMANHNACADDNALSAVEQGATLIHGTLHGYGTGQGYTDLACIGTALWRAQRRPVQPHHLEQLWDWSEILHRWLYHPDGVPVVK